MRRKNWQIIYRELKESPTILYSDEGKSVIVSGIYSRRQAWIRIKNYLKEYFGSTQPEYFQQDNPKEMYVAFLRRPIESENDDMDTNYVAEGIKIKTPRKSNDVWMYDIHIHA